MDATCNNCNHWNTAADATQDKEGFGECDELSQPKANMHYILPVLQDGNPRNVGFITGAEFGCNHFESAAQA
jgi:hypothetical protein